MTAKANNAQNMDDEVIIDLTDIIEKGKVPLAKADSGLDTLVSDLANSSDSAGLPNISRDVDADIDALLSQLGQWCDTPKQALAPSHIVNPTA